MVSGAHTRDPPRERSGHMDQRIMKILTVTTLALAVVAGGSVLAAAPADGVMTTIKTFIDDFNKGDIVGAAATQAADVAIIDEFPPHAWHSPTAFKDWAA